MMKVLFLISAFFSSTIALSGGEPTGLITMESSIAAPDGAGAVLVEKSQAPEFINKTEPDYTSTDFLTKLMSLLASIYMGMWTLGEILTRISVWTDNKWDNKLAERVAQATWFLGAFCGRMGWKLPKLVIEHEAEKIVAKKTANTADKPV